MKKFILSAVLPLVYFLSCFALPPRRTAVAENSEQTAPTAPTAPVYACIVEDGAYFYAGKDTNRGLFLLPQTYYVKVLSIDEDFCKIEYSYDSEHTQKLIGYAKTDDLTYVDYIPNNPYLTHLFEVSYIIEDSQNAGEDFLDKITVTCAYYGDYIIGSKRYCYVLRDGSFGYIPKPDSLVYEKNGEYADYLSSKQQPQDSAPSPAQPQENKNSPAQIAILIVLCLLVPALATLIVKPPKKPPYEEE